MKKVISILAVVVLMVIMLFALTGCGINGNKKVATPNNDEANIQEESLNDSQAENREEIEYTEIEEVFDSGYALLRKTTSKEHIYYYVDETGKEIRKNTIYTSSRISEKYMNGYIIGNPNKKDDSYIEDYSGNKLLEASSSSSTTHITYGDVSKSGYVVMTKEEESLSGTTYKTTIEDMNGSVIYSVNGVAKSAWICDDIFYVGDVNPRGNGIYDDIEDKGAFDIVNAKTGKVQKVDLGQFATGPNISVCKNYFRINNYILSTDLEKVYQTLTYMEKGLTDNYYLSSGNIVDFSGNIVHSFEEDGGVKEIYYYDNTYYVVSNTGFLYTMNDSFEKISEPIKFDDSLIFTTEGVVAKINGSVGILDKNLNIPVKIDDKGDLNIEQSNKIYDNFIYFHAHHSTTASGPLYYAYDLKENKYISFYE